MSTETGFSVLDKLVRRVQEEALLAPLWPQGRGVALVDQTRLPFIYDVLHIETAAQMADAVRQMKVRGSGAIGCAGALGAYLIVRQAPDAPQNWDEMAQALREARPTAVALRRAVDEVLSAAKAAPDARAKQDHRVEAAAEAAAAFVERQLTMERAIGRHGAAVIPDGATVLTHCHSGALAGAGYGGRALSVIRAAHEQGKQIQVIAQETRPYFQGARITAYELRKLDIPVTLITDGMSGAMMESGRVDVCVVGSDRLAINGDLANKTGTYLVALAAREHDVPFYTATTRYNVDATCATGNDIPIELRDPREVLTIDGRPITVEGVQALYPAFDITPASLLSGIVTEGGLFQKPFEEKLRGLLSSGRLSATGENED